MVVTGGSFPALQLVPHRVDALRAAGCTVSVAVVEPTSWPPEEIAELRRRRRRRSPTPRQDTRRRPRRRCAAANGERGGDGSTRSPATSPSAMPAEAGRATGMTVSARTGRRSRTSSRRSRRRSSPPRRAVPPRRWDDRDDFEREAFAHDVATSYVARRAREALEAGQPPMDLAAENDLIRRAIAAYFHAGKFQALLDIDGVTDIMVNGHDAIWLQYVDGRTERHLLPVFADAEDLRDEVAHLARRAGGTERRFDDGKPLLVVRLPDGSRLAAVMNVSPVPQVAIRRNVLPDASLDDLEQRGTIDAAMHSLLAAAMPARMRVVVSGETGAGKTTLVRAMTNELPPETRIVVIEDTRELNLGVDPARANAVLEWETREANVEGVGEISQRELVRHALRFNPDWLIVGEVRDGDAAREMLLAMQHGHPSLSTVHHHSALLGVEEARPVRRPGARSGRVLDRSSVDLRRRRLLRPPRPRPPGSAGRRRDLRGRGLERVRGPAQPDLRRRSRRPRPSPGAPVGPPPRPLARRRLRRSPPAQPGRMVAAHDRLSVARRAARRRNRDRGLRRRHRMAGAARPAPPTSTVSASLPRRSADAADHPRRTSGWPWPGGGRGGRPRWRRARSSGG